MSTLNILVLNHLAERHIAVITGTVPESKIITCELENAGRYIADTDILLAWGWTDIRPLYLAAPKLKWVHALSAGVESLLFPEIQNNSTILTNSRGIHGIPMAEHTFAMILAFTRGLNLSVRQQIVKKWKRVPADEIYEKTIGIIGLGSIGREIAKKAKGLDMRVLAVKREPTTEPFVDKMYTPATLLEMLPLCDFVVIALPLVAETKEYLRLEHFAVMKRSAYFINIARGGVIREDDLITALKQGLIAGAGLDVFDQEPLPEASPLWDMPNVLATPHQAALSPYYLDRAVKLFADNLSRFVRNDEMLNVIDKVKGY